MSSLRGLVLRREANAKVATTKQIELLLLLLLAIECELTVILSMDISTHESTVRSEVKSASTLEQVVILLSVAVLLLLVRSTCSEEHIRLVL